MSSCQQMLVDLIPTSTHSQPAAKGVECMLMAVSCLGQRKVFGYSNLFSLADLLSGRILRAEKMRGQKAGPALIIATSSPFSVYVFLQ